MRHPHRRSRDHNELDNVYLMQDYRSSPLTTNRDSAQDPSEYRISLRSLDDDEVRQFLRSLITPIPSVRSPSVDSELHSQRRNRFSDLSLSDTLSERGTLGRDRETPSPWLFRGENRSESVMLFKKLMTGEEDVPLNFATSDIKDFVDPAMLEEIMSRPGSRLPRTESRMNTQSVETSDSRSRAPSPQPASPRSPVDISKINISEPRQDTNRPSKNRNFSVHADVGNTVGSSSARQSARRSSESSVIYMQHPRNNSQDSSSYDITENDRKMNQILSRSMQKTKMLLDVMERSMLEESVLDAKHRPFAVNTNESSAERPKHIQPVKIKSDEIKRHSVDMDAILALRRDTDALLERRLSVLKNRASTLLDNEKHDQNKSSKDIPITAHEISYVTGRNRRKTIHTNTNVSSIGKDEDPALQTSALNFTRSKVHRNDDPNSSINHAGRMEFTPERQRAISVPAGKDERHYSNFQSKRNRTASLPGGSPRAADWSGSFNHTPVREDKIENQFEELDELSNMNLQSKTSQRILMNHIQKRHEERRGSGADARERRSSRIIDLRNHGRTVENSLSQQVDDTYTSRADAVHAKTRRRSSALMQTAKTDGNKHLGGYREAVNYTNDVDHYRREDVSASSESSRSTKRNLLHSREGAAQTSLNDQSNIPTVASQPISDVPRNHPLRRGQVADRISRDDRRSSVRKTRESRPQRDQDADESVTEAAMALLNSIRHRRRNTHSDFSG